MIDQPQDEIVQALQPYTSCDCSDALLKLKYPNGGFLPGPRMLSPLLQAGDTKIVGKAYTVLYAKLDDPRPKLDQHYIDSVPPGSVIFISSPPDIYNAVYGGLMSYRAQASGAVGTIVDGRIRDLNEHREIGFPVFARDTGTAAPQGLLKVVATNIPVHLHSEDENITVHPGDYLIADLDGVVLIPQGLAHEMIPLIKPQVDADEQMKEAIKGGKSFAEASKKYRR